MRVRKHLTTNGHEWTLIKTTDHTDIADTFPALMISSRFVPENIRAVRGLHLLSVSIAAEFVCIRGY
jgi:hypothetical protein